MLKNIDPILGPELLFALRAMGHGDEIAIVDGNYPALSDAKRLVRADGLSIIAVVNAVLSVLPVDDFVPRSLFRSAKGDDVNAVEPVHLEIEAACKKHAPEMPVEVLVGEVFYNRVKSAHAIIATSEPRLYANLIIRKGVIYP